MIKTVNINPGGSESFFQDGKGDEKIPNTSRYAWPTNSGRSSSNRSYPSRSSRSKTNSFFIRNSPHPSRVKHIKGLLDAPICTVLDAGAEEGRPGTRFSIATPNTESDSKKKNMGGILKLPLSHKLKEKPVPHIGLVPIVPDWKEELKRLTQAMDISINADDKKKANTIPGLPSRQGTRQGVRQSSRQASRESLRKMENDFVRNSVSRGGQRLSGEDVNGNVEAQGTRPSASRDANRDEQLLNVNEENEEFVFGLLTQILQTDSAPAIQHWLVNAPEREKQIVMNMIKAVSTSDEQLRDGLQHIRNPAFKNEYKTAERDEQRPVYDDQLLQHESSVDYEEIKKYNEEWKKSEEMHKTSQPKSILEKLEKEASGKQGKSYTDYEWSASSAANKPSTPFKLFEKEKPKLGSAEAEIEEIRSKLASRSSCKVLGPQKPSSRLSNRPATQQGEKQKASNSNAEIANKQTTKTVAPFSE